LYPSARVAGAHSADTAEPAAITLLSYASPCDDVEAALAAAHDVAEFEFELMRGRPPGGMGAAAAASGGRAGTSGGSGLLVLDGSGPGGEEGGAGPARPSLAQVCTVCCLVGGKRVQACVT
jgi:hypothetical protein